jgi:hypothetical protein
LTDDVELIKTCIKADAAAVCIAPCQWRDGLNTDGTDTTPGTDIPLPGDFKYDGPCQPLAATTSTVDKDICYKSTDPA